VSLGGRRLVLIPRGCRRGESLKYNCPMDLPAGVSIGTFTYTGTRFANPHAVTSIGNGTATTTYSYDNNGNFDLGRQRHRDDYLHIRLRQSSYRPFRWSRDHDLRIRRPRRARLPDRCDDIHQHVPVQVLLHGLYDQRFDKLLNVDRIHLVRRYTSLHCRPEAGKWCSERNRGRSIRTPRSPRFNKCRDRSKSEPGANFGFLSLRSHTGLGSTSTNEKRKFIGQFSDESGLSYLNARYYSSDRGQFISQDPVFWEIGLTDDGKKALQRPDCQSSPLSVARRCSRAHRTRPLSYASLIADPRPAHRKWIALCCI
jgi:RHS repeat-associated protein